MADLTEDLDQQFLEACETGNLDEVLRIFYYEDHGQTTLLQTDPASLNHMHYFHAACFNGHYEVVEQLIVFKVDVNLNSRYGSPLSVACQGGHLETVKLLVEHNAIVFDPNSLQVTLSPIFQACKNGHVDVLTYLLSQAPEAVGILGHRLLVQACHDGFLDMVVLLVSKDVDVNGICDNYFTANSCIQAPMDELSASPLHAACSQGNVEVVEYLLQEGAKVTVDLVQSFHNELGKAVYRNFKEYSGKFKKEIQEKLLCGDFRACGFHAIHQSWFTHFQVHQLVEIDVSNNHLQNIPKELFNLEYLKKIDVSGNGLFYLPEVDNVHNSSLEEIIATSNALPSLPMSFFQLKTLRHLNAAKNEIGSLESDQGYSEIDNYMADEIAWHCIALKCLNLAKNQLVTISLAIHSAKSLEKLQLSNNKIKFFPVGWKCPLRILDLARNELADFQQSIFTPWKHTLEDLNLRSNKLSEIAWDICQLDALQRLDLGENNIEAMPPKSYWTCKNLRRLILDNNKLCGVHPSENVPVTQKRFSLVRSPHQDDIFIEDQFADEVYGATLETLDLSNNRLCEVPSSVCQLRSLEELDLSDNRNLKTLPAELGNLTECHLLGLEGLHLSGIPKYVRPGRNTTSKDLLTYLRAKQRKSVPYYRMKLMVIGLQGRGKTTLLAALRGKPTPPNISTVGIVVNEWTLQRSQSLLEKLSKSTPPITFSTWDLAGQQIYYSTHQCFLSSNTLYLAVWNVSHGEKGVEKLKPWLLNVQARAPGSHVIIVGTHADLLPEKIKTKRIDELRLAINKKYDKKGFPLIKGNCVVSCTTGENIEALRQEIYNAAIGLKEAESRGKGDTLIGRKIPLSYLRLQENVVKEAEIRKKENKPPILNEEQMLEIAKQDPNNDILGRDELVLAARFLHENGVILHYDDRSRGLDKLYFIEPGWLCDIMALLVTVKETNAFVRGGIVERANVNLMLRSPRLPPEFMDQYIQLMERFEVALILDEHRLLVPSMLPRDKPGIYLSQLRKRTTSQESSSSRESDHCTEELITSQSEYLVRLYKMNYVPSGFWSRLIARLMIAVQKWGAEEGLGDELICSQGGKAVRTTTSVRPVPHGYTMIYWREGMGVVYDGGQLMVESFAEKERNIFTRALEDIEGVKVTVWSAEQDFSVLGFVTDQINSLISEWYPGLEENDNYGIPLVRHVIPCPTCALHTNSLSNPDPGDGTCRMHKSISVDNISAYEQKKNKEFTLTECAAAAVSHKEITCPAHVEEPVKLESLVPDLMLSDLPDELLIDPKFFEFDPVEENRLGSGGAGEVFLGSYRKQRVAIKRFYSTKETWKDSGIQTDVAYAGKRSICRHTDGSSFMGRRVFSTNVPTLEEELQRTKILSSFWELRQEVSVLARLNHPCVVALVGVCVQPLTIVLELSPLGSLFSILENELKKEENERFMSDTQKTIDIRNTIFERELTYRIVYQVAHALHYLHSLGIIYRDLKSDNLLVWTLDKDAIVHVKLSDYGISRFATPQGMLGEEGTPGFQAPEVRNGAMYNEMVDIFSFAMVIYELLSGYRPYSECRCSAQIKKAVRRGERPSLESHSIDSKMPQMEGLMEKCWRESISNRPTADVILRQMEDPSFLCLTRVLPYADQKNWTNIITAFIPLSTQDQVFNDPSSTKGDHSVLLWSGENEERSYSVVDCLSGFFQIKETLCVGARVACLVKVGDRYWLGTEGSTIDVFGRPDDDHPSPGRDLTVLWAFKVKSPVLCLLVDQELQKNDEDDCTTPYVRRVFASLANGTVVVISRPEFRSTSSSSTCLVFRKGTEKLRREAATFSTMTPIQVGDRQSPACSMVFVNDDKELWVGCGNHISILDVDTLQVGHKFRAYVSPRSNVREMVSYGSSVFTINRKSCSVLQWDISSRRLLYKFNCDLANPIDSIIAHKVLTKNDDETSSVSDEGTDSSFPSPRTDEETDAQPEETQPATDEKPADHQIVPDVPPHFRTRPPSLMRSIRRKGSRNSSRRSTDRLTVPESISVTNTSHVMRTRTNAISGGGKCIRCAVVVDGNLWLGNVTGDILVVDISCMTHDEGYGRVLGVLSLGAEHGYSKKEIDCLKMVGTGTVVSCARLTRDRKHQDAPIKPCTSPPPTKTSFVASTSPFKSFLRPTTVAVVPSPKVDEGPNEKNQLTIWARWNRDDFKQFKQYHIDLERHEKNQPY